MKTLALILGAAFVGACAFAPEEEIVTSITLPSSAESVYEVLTNGDDYPEWNPFIISFEGKVGVGEKLAITVDPANGDPMSFTPEVLVADAGRELRWLGAAPIPGVFDGEHYFVLSEVPEGTTLTHGERFSGVALWFMDVTEFRNDFEAMNEALARRLAAES